MYTTDEIKKEARKSQLKGCAISFVLELLLLGFILGFVVPAMSDSYKPNGDIFFYYFQFLCFFVAIVLIGCLPSIVYKNKKKQLEEENRNEELEQRERYYKKMEDFMNKQEKDVRET